MTPRRIAKVVLAAVVALCFVACGNVQEKSKRAKRQQELKLLGLVALGYNEKYGTFPANYKAFLKAVQGDSEYTQLVQETGPGGNITFHYGAWKLGGPAFEPQGSNKTLLAVDSTVWSGGQKVALFADGSVRMMTEAEIAKTPLPKQQEKKD